jgi:hypothetical protein
VIALAGNLDFFDARFLTCLTAVLVARLNWTFAGEAGTFLLLTCGHRGSPFLSLVGAYESPVSNFRRQKTGQN